jgi:hypothetical protein
VRSTRSRRSSSRRLLALALAAGVAGCGHAPPPRPPVVAVLPVDTLGLPPAEGAALEAAVWRDLESARAARPAPPARVTAALATVDAGAAPGSCREQAACLAGVGRRVPSDLVLALALAGLGDLRLVRSRLVRASDGLALQDLQETVQGGGAALDGYAQRLTRRLFPEAGRRPWYRSWWFWSSVAAVAGATAAITWATVGTRPHESGVVHVGDL